MSKKIILNETIKQIKPHTVGFFETVLEIISELRMSAGIRLSAKERQLISNRILEHAVETLREVAGQHCCVCETKGFALE